MGRIPEEIIEDVLARTDIVQIVEQYVTLKKAGTNHKGLCPFHNEKTPSFNVHGGDGYYKCFGCGAGGSVFQFLMEIEGWNFPETVRHLANRVGVEIPEETEEEAREARKRSDAQKLYRRVMELSCTYYEKQLWNEGGEAARAYLHDRGIDEATSREFRLGYAPAGWQNLLDYLGENGINGALCERAGLAISRRENSGYYDRFRDRVMFPVIDNWGHALAFGGRVLPGDDGPKYINSSETRFYTKGRNLFGLHAAKKGLQQAGYGLLVEGNFDVIALHAFGLKMVVAPMGTAFTDTQARLLKRYVPRAIVAFDGDSAGEEATVKALPALERAGLEALVIRFDKGDDPDTFIRREGKEAFDRLLQNAQPLIGWALDRVIPKSEQLPIEERLKALEEASKIMEHVREPVVWKHYAEDLSRRLDIEARLFKRYLRRPEQGKEQLEQHLAQNQPGEDVLAKLDGNEFTLLVLLLKHPGWLGDFLGEQLDNLLESAELAKLLHDAQALARRHDGELDPKLLIEHVEHPGWRKLVLNAFSSSSNDAIEDHVADAHALGIDEREAQVYQDLIRSLKWNWANRSLEQVLAQIEELSKDFVNNREAFIVANEQKKQLEQFREQHAAAQRE